MLNSAGYYTEPTPGHVAVALLKAKINNDKSNPNVYLTQDLSQVYTNPDRRTYPLSSYSYMILPTDTHYGLEVSTGKGATLGDFGKYLLCQGQNQVDALGYSALPINLVEAGFEQLRKIPGANVANINISKCNNPTFSTNGTNTLATTDPYPPACDKKGPSQCVAGTGGAKGQSTPVNPSAQAGNPTGGSNGVGGSGGNGGSGGSGPNNSGSGGNGSSGPGGTGPGGSTGAVSGPGGVVNEPAGSSSAAAAAAQQAACDPDTGCAGATGASANGALDPLPNPTSASASLGDGLRVTLMALAAALLLGLGLGPPLIAHVSDRRRQRQAGGAP
jgi:uncharacterized membrane protein YgcG